MNAGDGSVAHARRPSSIVWLRRHAPADEPRPWYGDLAAALVPWVLARGLVLGALGLARFIASGLHTTPRPVALGQGLFAWDAAFYRSIAEHGYHQADGRLRFFPLVPIASRALGWVTGDAVALIVVANVSALVLAVLLARLVRRETGDEAAVDRVLWLLALAPPAAILVLGYAEATFTALAVATFLCLRRRSWWAAAAAGFLAGLTRPFGALLAPAAAIEAWRGWRDAGPGERVGRVAAVVGPAAGTGTYLAWVGLRFGDWLEPLHLQERSAARGGFQQPLRPLWRAAGDLVARHHIGTGLHSVWAVGFVALLVVVARRLPASYTVFAGLGLALILSAHNLDSMERYGLSLFPFLLVGALLTRREHVARGVFAVSAAGLLGYSLLTFFGLYVP